MREKGLTMVPFFLQPLLRKLSKRHFRSESFWRVEHVSSPSIAHEP